MCTLFNLTFLICYLFILILFIHSALSGFLTHCRTLHAWPFALVPTLCGIPGRPRACIYAGCPDPKQDLRACAESIRSNPSFGLVRRRGLPSERRAGGSAAAARSCSASPGRASFSVSCTRRRISSLDSAAWTSVSSDAMIRIEGRLDFEYRKERLTKGKVKQQTGCERECCRSQSFRNVYVCSWRTAHAHHSHLL